MNKAVKSVEQLWRLDASFVASAKQHVATPFEQREDTASDREQDEEAAVEDQEDSGLVQGEENQEGEPKEDH